MKKALFLMVAAMSAYPGAAEAAGFPETAKREAAVYTIGADGSKTYWHDGREGGLTKGETVISGKFRKNAGPRRIATIGDPKSLDIEIRYDESRYHVDRLGGGMLDGSDFDLTDLAPVKNVGRVDVPYGISSLFACFQTLEPDPVTGLHDLYFLAKDISGLSAGSKVVMDISDCVHRVSYEALKADGTPATVSTYTPDRIMVEKGDYADSFNMFYWSHRTDHALWYSCFGNRNTKMDDGSVRNIKWGNVWFNDCGPDFSLGCAMLFHPVEGADMTIIEMPVYQGTYSKVPSESVLRNSPEHFNEYVQHFTRTPYSTATASDLSFGARFVFDDNGVTCMGVGSNQILKCDDREIDTRLFVCHNESSDPSQSGLRLITIDICPEDDSDFGIASMWWRPSDNGREYLPINHCGEQEMAMPYETYLNFVEGNYSDWLLCYGCPNPFLAPDDSKIAGRLGNSCPFLALRHENIPELASDYAWTFPGLVGRYGEGNIYAMQFCEYTPNMGEYDSDDMRWEKYYYDNVLVDGETEGSLNVRIGFKKGTADDDYIAPVLTSLGMRTTDGMLTDRFATPDEGVIEIYAADLDLGNDWSLGEWFMTYQYGTLLPDGVRIEYAPYGSGDFRSLDVTPMPEKRFVPGWGDCYTCSTSGVDRKSGNGWFDLRVTLVDGRGNTQEQVVSPAFRISSAVGAVDDITDSVDGGDTFVYDLMGRCVSEPESGIYIVRGPRGTRKIMK